MGTKWIVSVHSDADIYALDACRRYVKGHCDMGYQFRAWAGNIIDITFSDFWVQDRVWIYDFIQDVISKLKSYGVDVFWSEEKVA